MKKEGSPNKSPESLYMNDQFSKRFEGTTATKLRIKSTSRSPSYEHSKGMR